MKKTFWSPVKKRRYRYDYVAVFVHPNGITSFTKEFSNGPEREKFILEQNSLIRQCKTLDDYVSLYKNIRILSE